MPIMNLRMAFLLLSLCCFPLVAFAQERKPIDWFYFDANYQSKKLLLKHLQFTAPFPGYYQQTYVDTDGNAFTCRNVPNWAMQGTMSAKLDDALLGQIRQMLAQLSVKSIPADLEPQSNRFHTAFVFHDGHEFRRVNFNGPNPPQIDAIMQILQKQFKAAAERRDEEFKARERFLKETYGDWHNRQGITIYSGGQMITCKGNRALVLWTYGQREGSPTTVSLYHALILYPGGAVNSSGSGGRSRNDPVQSYGLTWRLPNANGSYDENSSERKLEIQHNAIDTTLTIAGKVYQLNGGNLFMIRIGEDWVPTVTQLNDKLVDQSTLPATLDRFKAILKDDSSIQALELYRR